MTFRLLETPIHPSYLTVSKMEVPSPLMISEMWSLLQALCMAVCYTQINRPSNSRENSFPSRWGWYHSLRRIRLLSSYGSQSRFISYFYYKINYLIFFFYQMFRKRRKRNWILSSVKGEYLYFPTNPIYHTSMLLLQKFFDGIVLHPQVLTSLLHWATISQPNPLGVPHMASEDGYIGGYFIPKDSLILTNLWYVRS